MRRTIIQAASEEDESEINLTPMLDVVFIMLIFFIVTASFVKEAGIDVNRPDAQTREVLENANILVAISESNEIWIDRRRIDPRAVRAVLERLHAENPEGAVVIQADKKAYTETVILVMDSARLAKIFNISIAAQDD
ncbi:MAG: biopolymer transporter ExbD [Gammaproteobacteria bacterium]|jgi:biopolymer transport protein ExbD|nr:biopolymer transporter ExbD [Gammaproteobacteria bacterium]